MQATSSLHSPVLSSRPCPFLGNSLHRPKIIGFNQLHRPTRTAMVYASNNDAYGREYDGKVVDENMVVLRQRIQEMRMEKMSHEPPSHWMEWEKQYCVNYDSHVCEAMQLLQSLVMNTRPSLALGMVALIMLSVPTSMVLIVFHLMEVAKGMLAGISP